MIRYQRRSIDLSGIWIVVLLYARRQAPRSGAGAAAPPAQPYASLRASRALLVGTLGRWLWF
jgi:hypothetical protein